MNIPNKVGKTSLAYITNEERKLLRRRDAVKGSPNKKMAHGLPKLDGGGGGDYLDDMRRSKELRAKEDALRAAGFKETYAGGAVRLHVGSCRKKIRSWSSWRS
jgi:hypothetical protein